MTSPTGPGDEKFVAASSELNDGLKSCRAVVSNYRSLLAGESPEEAEQAGLSESGDEDVDSSDWGNWLEPGPAD